MNPWVPLPDGVEWKGPPLFNFRASRAELVQALGPPHVLGADSNGLGPYDAWALRFECGLEVCVWLFHLRPEGSSIKDPEQLANVEVYANERHERHILFHLPLTPRDVSYWVPTTLTEPTRRFRVMRRDDNGNTFHIATHSSRCEADAVVAAFDSRGHKQTYWVEEYNHPG